ncbi:unnamed protein product [Allacma fusca]|uniref:Uncharacterized protein n=1 Tax=Allacma fusca TaxID=39272 RepID=A0A8J2KJZ6_9HEXA|nr:unnamed protein product [Allacma fusca]
MPTENIEIAAFENGEMKRRSVPGLTSETADECQELYFLVVEGDGTYVANGFICYHELPRFEAWPKTFAAIFETVNYEKFSQSGNQEFSLEQFKDLVKVTEKIRNQWEILVNNVRPAEDETNGNVSEDFQRILSHLGLILNDQWKSSFGMILYSRCGEFLHRHLDVQGMPFSQFVNAAREILQGKD